ncbi:FMN-binding negative transcriptional regulator [Alteromonas pelagimontana]|uniref:FMN-binding negative transcriptional regulator n=1 Tax=Alteromonas pelagimontana TaxID=1858656 RepID=A0A6M4M9U0_9ALTE|nr:FMN-binding negative transcriptional regulator [Alteromonas pelagimontana]QJR79739.1 FMN-binding negative transcriptional regulator [Alteromonas pelagimontana]
MYVPKNMELSNSDAITSLISGYGFGLLISPDMETTRLPLLYESGTESSSILGHMARANPQWRDLSGKRVSVVFNGPHSYISPRWYVSKPAVPTWNYASVQCFGIFQELNSIETLSAIYALIRKYEPELMDKEGERPVITTFKS